VSSTISRLTDRKSTSTNPAPAFLLQAALHGKPSSSSATHLQREKGLIPLLKSFGIYCWKAR